MNGSLNLHKKNLTENSIKIKFEILLFALLWLDIYESNIII
ncbi:hypothetical protein GMMP15_140047 [Candidatus Magnetomoraceae bacterium gMMP-15]